MDTGMTWFLGALAVFVGLILYIYMAICLMSIAKKTNTPHPWLAWIPLANVFLMTMIAKKHWWWALILLLSYCIAMLLLGGGLNLITLILCAISIIFTILIWIGICQARNRPGWWAVLLFIPLVNLVIIGILAFSKK